MAARKESLTDPGGSLSKREYVAIAGAAILIGLSLLLLFIWLVPRLLPAGLTNQFYYIVLLSWGLVCSLVLFGVLKGYARVKYKKLNLAVELGGPVAVAALVVVGGFWLLPNTESFQVTVRAQAPLIGRITKGTITLEYGANSQTKEISNGDADFKEIPIKFRGTAVTVFADVPGFKKDAHNVTLEDVILLNLAKDEPTSVLKGQLQPMPIKGAKITILVEGEPATSPDQYGRFSIVVHKAVGEKTSITICENGLQIYSGYQIITGSETPVPTHRSKESCVN